MDTGLTTVFPKALTQKAEEELRRAAQENREPDHKAKQQIRGSKVLLYFLTDVAAKDLEKAIVLNEPFQHYINCSLKAQKLSAAYADLVCFEGVDLAAPSEEALAARQLAVTANLKILSGTRGQDLVDQVLRLCRSYQEPEWVYLTLSSSDLHSTSLQLISGMADAKQRLVWYFKQGRFEILQVAKSVVYNAALVRQVTEPLRFRGEQCSRCVEHFTKVWIKRLEDNDEAKAAKAHTAVGEMTALMAVCGAKVENKHTVGQNFKKKKGRTLTAVGLGKQTYKKSATSTWARRRDHVVKRVLGSNKKTLRLFGQYLAHFSVGKPSRRKVGKKGKRKMFTLARAMTRKSCKPKASRGYDVFVRRNYNREGPINFEERRRVDGAWKDLDEQGRAPYVAIAKAEAEQLEELNNMTFQQIIEA